MAFALIFVGILLTVSAVRGTHDALFALVRNDFTGPNNFTFWAAAVILIGSIGYIQPLRPLSRALLVLIIVVLLLTKGNPARNSGGGFFAQLIQGINTTTSTVPPATSAGAGSQLPGLLNRFGTFAN